MTDAGLHLKAEERQSQIFRKRVKEDEFRKERREMEKKKSREERAWNSGSYGNT